MNKLAVLVGVVLIFLSAGFIYVMITAQDEPVVTTYVDETFVFVDSSGEEIAVQYDYSAEFAKVTYAGNVYELNRVESASGVEYQTSNGRVIFFERQGEARLEISDEVVVIGLRETPDSTPDTTTEDVTDLSPVVTDPIEVIAVPVLGQQCVDSATVDCAALEAAASI